MSGPDRPIQPENRIEARRWLAIVEEDIDVAIAAAGLTRRSAWHVQQAAEKLLKALLVLAAEPFRRTHDLDDLAARLLPVYPQFARQAEAVRHLSIWGIAYRYPGLEDAPEPLPEIEELDRIIDIEGVRRDDWQPHRRVISGDQRVSRGSPLVQRPIDVVAACPMGRGRDTFRDPNGVFTQPHPECRRFARHASRRRAGQ
jgi:HEPN domain-containing protein